MDIAIQFHKKKKRHERTWEFGVYNAYNRRNPFFYNIDEEMVILPNVMPATPVPKYTLKRYSLFPILPYFSYNFKF
jgi:hypothetical protein